jgi:hypothetical protein
MSERKRHTAEQKVMILRELHETATSFNIPVEFDLYKS